MEFDIKGCIVRRGVPLSEYTTFKTGGCAAVFVEPESAEALSEAVKFFKKRDVKYRVLGNGSNLIVSDGGTDFPVIHIGRKMAEVKAAGNELFCKAGALLSSAARAALKESLTGMEFAHGIPGSVGGAVRMNAGAYGGEMKDIVKEIEFIDENGDIKRMTGSEAEFGYRKSIFQKKNYIVTEAVVELKKGDYDLIDEKMKELAARRREKQPLEFPSAGSVFKRPEGHFAAALIEEAGLKGVSVGGAEVSEKHAGFIINKGGAKASDVLALIEKVRERVKENSGVLLETEVEIWQRSL